jgi:hypothetical protein
MTELRAQDVVAPNVLATNDGNSSITASGSGAFRSMLILDASQFDALSGPSCLTQIARRPVLTNCCSAPLRESRPIGISPAQPAWPMAKTRRESSERIHLPGATISRILAVVRRFRRDCAPLPSVRQQNNSIRVIRFSGLWRMNEKGQMWPRLAASDLE